MGPDGPAPQDAQAFIASLDEVDLSRFRVVGAYTRYDEVVRNALQDARQKILAGFEPPGPQAREPPDLGRAGDGQDVLRSTSGRLSGRARPLP